ncbi:HNH endonuclease [Methylobacterium terricola]|uniref:HNH endonuclease n=1 Tax=Methylobacterium terricola TaxID=2583531 RepID=A0A5C4LF98_9HYPH|nr:HNH endonuclease [Methylobacterium terricola]TNC12488.1 HNH endonuclease [Methylobacterium terricola]
MVHLFVAITDRDWFDALARQTPDEVNFWQPSGRYNFRALQPGELLLFKLHAPDDVIVGGGVFSHGSLAPLSLAWEAFETRNGASSLAEMRRRIARYRREAGPLDPRSDPMIGCRILTQPFFWPRAQWLPTPASFAKAIVQGKGYSTDELEGRAIWDAVTERLATGSASEPAAPAVDLPRYGSPVLVLPRLGQGAFRLAVTDGYERRCAVTGERTLPILDAAHIRPFTEGGAHHLSNGLLLRTDIHRLFDLGYVTVSPDHRFEVSARLKADFDNGRQYYDLHGATVRPPRGGAPSPDALRWHREERYRG